MVEMLEEWVFSGFSFSFLSPGEGKAELLKLQDSRRRLTAHVVNSVLIPKPVRPLNSIVRVPPPVVFGHVPQSGVDASLGGDGVGAGGEELGYAGCFEAGLGEAHCGAEASAARTDDAGVVLVVDWGEGGVLEGGRGGC